MRLPVNSRLAEMWRVAFLLLLGFLVAGCARYGPEPAGSSDIEGLRKSLLAMSHTVSEAEARQAAELAFASASQLARSYQITDPPLIHNAKVNAGTRPRGLCYHWAEDMERIFNAAGFETLGVVRAIANAENPLLIDHSTAVLVHAGAGLPSGIVIDPWRYGGRLFWSPVAQDQRYNWKPRIEVLKRKGLVRYAHRSVGSLAALPGDLTD